MDSDTNNGLTRTPVAWRHRDIALPRSGLPGQPVGHYAPAPTTVLPSRSSNVFHFHHSQHSQHPQHLPPSHHHPSSSNQRTSSPSILTTSSDDREEVPMVRHHHHHHSSSHRHNTGDSVYSQTIDRRPRPTSKHYHQIVPRTSGQRGSIVSYGPGPMRGYRTATLRSTRSFPGLMMASVSTWDGEPCPIHGPGHPHSNQHPQHPQHPSHPQHLHPQHFIEPSTPSLIGISGQPPSNLMTIKRFNSLSDLRRPSLTPLIAYTGNGSNLGTGPTQGQYEGKPLGTKLPLPQYVGTMFRSTSNLPAHFVPSGQLLIPANGSVAPIEAIKNHFATAAHVNSLVYDDTVCCKGHLIVLWIILTVVTIGVISGIILGVTAN